MSDVVTFSLADGTTVAVAPANSRVGTGAVGLGDRLQTAEQSLREALAPVTAAAAEMMDGFRQAGRRPDLFLGYAVGAALMITGGLVTAVLGVAAEGRSLEDIAVPLSVKEHLAEQAAERADVR
ncbi:hypothetical protein [Streptomyces sp. MNU76]|uniref:hypothetical protein n=1 Tax=Streptomyces sp. MNU76 TaxID=2560026 RepID=UPI00227F5922|nr:hypothetical protein [Streptomyces sp. MNU76]